MYREINHQRSQEAAKLVDAQAKACWRNAILAQQHFPEATYIEGWVVIPEGIVLEHGWLELDLEIVDPTFVSRLENDADSPVYFPGLQYTLQEVSDELAERNGELPLVYGDGRWGKETPSYMLASCDAWEYACSLAHVNVDEKFIQQVAEMRELYIKRL